MSHSRSMSLQTRRRPHISSLFILFDTEPIKSPTAPSSSSSLDIELASSSRSTTIRPSRAYRLRPKQSSKSSSLSIRAAGRSVDNQSTLNAQDMPFGASQQYPPTPSPSIYSASRAETVVELDAKMFANAEAGPSSAGLSHSLPPTPPIHEEADKQLYDLNSSSSSLAFAEPTITQRPRRGRRPASVYPPPAEGPVRPSRRKYTDPTPGEREYALENSPGLDVDLDAYSTTDFEGEEEREPTLSIVTSSTADSTTGTPASIGGPFDYKSEFGKTRLEGEPRIRMRTTAGRSNAYSSAESSTASGAYSYHAYADNNIYHPHPPPLPNIPATYARADDHVGLGITADDLVIPTRQRDSQVTSSPSTGAPESPANSFTHRPWKRDVMNRLRSDSAASSLTTASTSTSGTHVSATGESVSSNPYSFAGYAHNLPWETDDMEQVAPEAITLVEEGKERIFNGEKLEEMGGLDGLTEEGILSLKGTTHLLLPDVGCDLSSVLSPLLSALAPTLVVLDLSNNYLSFLPESLQYCVSLEELNISGNPLRALPTFIGELTGLRVLAMDECGLQSLPIELSSMRGLHTICARRNRLVSLPSWLCLLGQLDTLRVDDNPFAAEWQHIVAPILARPNEANPGQIPPRSSSYQHGTLRSRASLASIASTRSSVQSPDQTPAGSVPPSVHEDWTSPTSSAAQSMYQLSGLGPIAEDHPHSAPLEQTQPMMQPLAPPDDGSPRPSPPQISLRKMRSAGTLIGMSSEVDSDAARPTDAFESPNSASGETEFRRPDPSSPSAPNRFGSLGVRERRRAASIIGNVALDNGFSPPSQPRSVSLTTNASTKTSKWGFLRKMSMSRLKGEKSEKSDKTSLAASASANLKLLPPSLPHARTDFVPGRPVRPPMNVTRSAMTLPTRKLVPANEAGDLGRSTAATSSSTLPLGGSVSPLPFPTSLFGNGGGAATKRGKRRSFLPVDGPPSLNIAIPSTSPFMPPVPIFEEDRQSSNSKSEIASGDGKSASSALSEPPAATASVEADSEMRYATGLETIKSYLRDLYDLSRPPVEPYGGFEVVSTAEGSCGASSAPSDNMASPASLNGRGSISEARRARRPTLERVISRNPSTASVMESERGSFAEAPELNEGKKFKNDKAKRARVLREIYETERTYVRGLGELVTIYVRPASQPVNANKGAETVVPAAERKVVFGGIESIMSIHRDNLLPALERAVKPLLDGADDEDGELSTRTAHAVGEVFRTYIAYMKQYSTYINNFDNALSRMKTWTAPSSTPSTPGFSTRSPIGTPSISSAAISVGVGLGAVSLPAGDPVPHSGSLMSTGQRKRVKAFLKRCREHPMHSQINLESYLLLPIQRVPRYKLLLEDLAMCTLPRTDGPRDTLDDALNEIASLASLMNEEKRDADSRLRLLHWQQRISSRGPSPLVQPHRKLIMDGALTLIRLVKKASSFVEVDSTLVVDNEQTITSSKVVVPVEYIVPEPMDRPMMLVLCTDLLVLVQQRPGQDNWEGQVDLFNVLRMATLREPASIVHGNVLRVVDNKTIYYFSGASQSNTLQWCRAINSARRR